MGDRHFLLLPATSAHSLDAGAGKNLAIADEDEKRMVVAKRKKEEEVRRKREEEQRERRRKDEQTAASTGGDGKTSKLVADALEWEVTMDMSDEGDESSAKDPDAGDHEDQQGVEDIYGSSRALCYRRIRDPFARGVAIFSAYGV